MRVSIPAAVALVAALGMAVPAAAAPAPSGPAEREVTVASTATTHGWVPAPSAPWEREAGVICDFAVRSEPVVDEVMMRVLEADANGTPTKVVYTGDLVVRLTNLETGASTEADASGDAVVEYHADGSQTWYVRGPVLMGGRDTGGNLPRGFWLIDGVFTADITATGEKTVTMLHGTQHDVCTDVG
jgi:hypothetical protein